MGKSEFPWDLFDRCLLPVVFSHAAAVIVSTVFNILRISDASAFSLFLCFVSISLAIVIFFHTLKVTAAGKAVLVTGCDSGFGYAIARQLDDVGFTVFAGCLHKDDGGEDARKLKEASSGRLHVLQLDVTSEEQIQEAVSYVKQHLPEGSSGLWALVNNACWSTFGEVEWVPMPIYQNVANINLFSVVRMTQVFLPLIRKSKGRVINIASILGHVVAPTRSPYCISKFGVEAFSDCLRLEMRRWGVDVVIVEPGNFRDGAAVPPGEAAVEHGRCMWSHLSKEVREDYGEDYFARKVKLTEEQAKLGDSDISPVIRSVTDAVSRSFPLPRYQPMTPAEKIQILVADHLPHSVYDILYT